MTKLNISLDETFPVVCEECGNDAFVEAVHLRKVSGFLTGTGQSSIQPLLVFACTKCGHVNEEFKPKAVTQPKLG
jgi:uncharacterized Zn finger protein